MEFQGETYKLNGSTEEQYKRWRELLRQIYYTETGFVEPDVPDKDHPADKP